LLTHPTLDLLADLGLHGMAKGFRDLADNPEGAALGHAEWLGILLERESTLRQQKRFESRAKAAKLRHLAAVEDVDYRTPRGLDRAIGPLQRGLLDHHQPSADRPLVRDRRQAEYFMMPPLLIGWCVALALQAG